MFYYTESVTGAKQTKSSAVAEKITLDTLSSGAKDEALIFSRRAEYVDERVCVCVCMCVCVCPHVKSYQLKHVQT